MSLQTESSLDDTDWALIRLLEEDARRSLRELGKEVGLSAPAVSKRIDRMTAAGIIRGYRVDLDVSKIGLPLIAFTQISVARGKSAEIAKQLQAMPEVFECYRISGDYSYILKIQVGSVAHLEMFIDKIGKLGHSTTAIVLSASTKLPISSKWTALNIK